MARLVILDSDDDDDDFPSLRPPILTRRAGRPAAGKTAGTPTGKAAAAQRTPGVPATAVRRRKLGRIDNDESLLRPWTDEKRRQYDATPVMSRDSLASNRTKPRVELRTRGTRRMSEVPADDSEELSTEEASVLEDVAVADSIGVKTQNREEIANHPEGGEAAEGEDQDDGDDDDDEDDDTSEFLDSSSDSDFSVDSLNDFFQSPTNNKTATRPATTATRMLRERRSPVKKEPAAPLSRRREKREKRDTSVENVNEESTVFFSAEESLVDVTDALTRPLAGLSLDDSSIVTTKRERVSRPSTPPLELLPKTTQAAGLVSPSKKLPHIPMTPHRVSSNDFWNQQVVDDWNMEHSPRKLLFDDSMVKEKKGAGGTTSPRKKDSTAAKDREAKKAFQKTKHDMAEKFLAQLDSVVAKGELGRLATATGGVRIIWTNKLNTTAGRANWRRETLRKKSGGGTAADAITIGDTGSASSFPRVLHHASIELAEKVIDDEHRLLNVIAHEFCHLANFMVSGITGNPHGREFKAWAALCSRHFGKSHGIQVTTKHAYEIDFKYVWTCSECAAEFKRHSKSIDPARHRCGVCKGQLQQTKPVPRGAGAAGSKGGGNALGGSQAAPRPSEYQKFMKEHMGAVRQENPGSPQKVIMKLVADKWTQAKAAKAAKAAKPAGLGEPATDDNKENASTGISKKESSKNGIGAEADAGVDHLDKVFVDLTLD